MLPLEQPDRVHVAFDDHRLVANAGLLLPITMAHHLGLGALVELVAPVELKVMGWKKDGRSGVVIRGAGGPGAGRNQPGGGTIRTGGRVPWGAQVEYAYTTG